MFNSKSVIVITWANLVKSGKYSREEVPPLLNLREEVFTLLESME